MKTRAIVSAAALAGMVALGASTAADAGSDKKVEKEKCYGIVKAGQNDCGANNHACAAQAQTDGDPNEWVFMPKGLCDKLVGASTEPGSDKG